MDDGLVLNLAADDDFFGARKTSEAKKGGRWTDRLKAKRTTKRKVSHPEKAAISTSDAPDNNPRPSKQPRTEGAEFSSAKPTKTASATKTTQIISSLFTSNPKIDLPKNPAAQRPTAKPSNAPHDTSTFEGLGLHPLLIAHLASKFEIKRPTAIQRAALPPILTETDNKDLRDIFIQSQTGSGKTLAYLLPIIQDLLPLSSLSYIDRSIGTLAIIIAPTRELAKQISEVVEALLRMRLRSEDDVDGESENSTRMTRWLVSGLLVGGSTRTHEKAKLRKGVPILVSTPGRLLDHIQNTSSFNVGKCRWLVLDEADQLMELGFEETITGILKGLEGRRGLAKQAVLEGNSPEVGGWDWERRRRTVLCSATLRESVQTLVGTALIKPLMIKALEADQEEKPLTDLISNKPSTNSLTPPSQLSQKYVVVPLKLRLVALVALIRSLISKSTGGAKIIVFISCTDSVDFHWNLLGGLHMGEQTEETSAPQNSDSDSDEGGDTDDEEGDLDTPASKPKPRSRKTQSDEVECKCPLIPDTSIYRLHGSLPTATRMRALKGFAGTLNKVKNQPVQSTAASSVLLCTSVAARGLDLPTVKAVIQYDLPTEGGPNEYIHRIGRTARAGKGGEAWSMVGPSEAEWVKWIEARLQGEESEKPKKVEGSPSLSGVGIDSVLRSGYGGKGREYEARATEAQLSFERWVLNDKDHVMLARKAYLSHMRAYATHPSNEKHIFHIRHLHLGHLAKSFALREAPTKVTAANASKPQSNSKAKGKPTSKDSVKEKRKRNVKYDSDSDDVREGRNVDSERRMKAVVREQGRLTRKGGAMVRSGASEFQVMGGDYLENLAQH
ncbi:DEAD-domain-containing protein [Coprinopsis marcescibilis]|uniref:ATP-dependent RNA helicase n=1 Tax=Coprinopsis marcescibilis TaxID=230819 RepID=A0A5C3KUV0_COPMA|nr:DEAD-domain-containing protein [Coprinopsis marcescibilis]